MESEFEEMLSRNRGRLYYIARRYARRQGDVDDVLQEIYLQLWRSFDSFKSASSRDTWLYRVALNAAVSWLRKASRNSQTDGAGYPQELSEPEQYRCQASVLESFLNTLSDPEAHVLMMHLDNLSNAEIAEVMGVSANAISARLSRLKKQFEQTFLEN